MRTVLIVAVLLAILVMYLSARRRRAELNRQAAHPQLQAWQQAGAVSPELREQIVTIAAHRGSAAAIEHVRDISGLGAGDSTKLVEAVLASGRRPDAPSTTIDLTQAATSSLADEVRAERDRAGRTAAERLVRSRTGMSETEAVQFVASLR